MFEFIYIVSCNYTCIILLIIRTDLININYRHSMGVSCLWHHTNVLPLIIVIICHIKLQYVVISCSSVHTTLPQNIYTLRIFSHIPCTHQTEEFCCRGWRFWRIPYLVEDCLWARPPSSPILPYRLASQWRQCNQWRNCNLQWQREPNSGVQFIIYIKV